MIAALWRGLRIYLTTPLREWPLLWRAPKPDEKLEAWLDTTPTHRLVYYEADFLFDGDSLEIFEATDDNN